MKVYIQPGYIGREVTAIRTVLGGAAGVSRGWGYSYGPREALHVGSVEYIEGLIGKRKPDYYPEWTREAWHRKIETRRAFVKRVDGYKESHPIAGEFHISDLVHFANEWRHYCANGVSLCSWWYHGDEDTCESDPHGPELPFDLPEGFCGAVDIGRLESGEVALVEVQAPYAIGWYGEMSDSENYLEFLRVGWESLR